MFLTMGNRTKIFSPGHVCRFVAGTAGTSTQKHQALVMHACARVHSSTYVCNLEATLFWLQAQMVNEREISSGGKEEAHECGPRRGSVARTDPKVLNLYKTPSQIQFMYMYMIMYKHSSGQPQDDISLLGATYG
jgi:hypothetical protein